DHVPQGTDHARRHRGLHPGGGRVLLRATGETRLALGAAPLHGPAGGPTRAGARALPRGPPRGPAPAAHPGPHRRSALARVGASDAVVSAAASIRARRRPTSTTPR